MVGKPVEYKSLSDLPGENCYKLEVIEYYFDSNSKDKDRNFRITFKIDGVVNDCKTQVIKKPGISTNGGDSANVDNPYKNIEIDLKIPKEKNKYTGTLVETGTLVNGKYKITAIDKSKAKYTKDYKKEMVLDIKVQTDGFEKYIKLLLKKYNSYNIDRFRRRTYDDKDAIPEYDEILKNFNTISNNYYLLGKIETMQNINPQPNEGMYVLQMPKNNSDSNDSTVELSYLGRAHFENNIPYYDDTKKLFDKYDKKYLKKLEMVIDIHPNMSITNALKNGDIILKITVGSVVDKNDTVHYVKITVNDTVIEGEKITLFTKFKEQIENLVRIEERTAPVMNGGAPSRKSRRTRKSRKSHKARKSSKKSGRKSHRRSRR